MSSDLGCSMGRVEQMIRYAYWNTGCKGIVIGLSGGIDSAVAATFCCRAVGPDKVLGLSLPSSVSDPADARDAADLCARLGMSHRIVSIDPMLAGFKTIPDFTESPYLLGNLMARIRMTVLYYHANRDHRLVCGTSNRSEYMLGYCTKYGDNAADFQPILHLYKTEVYIVAKELDIPDPILNKVPSAGLWEGQSDEGEIGLSYADIDTSLKALEHQQWQAGTPTEEKVLALVKKSGHKRQPSPNLLAVCPE
ncbi:MAG: NAD+ synthase [Methanoregula sp.]|jgi:NAD+ synthase|uniref:NAD+ synthase n=1 Tax=Methanoregula sp. TaxID=2052170 RepID=UPI003C21CE41